MELKYTYPNGEIVLAKITNPTELCFLKNWKLSLNTNPIHYFFTWEVYTIAFKTRSSITFILLTKNLDLDSEMPMMSQNKKLLPPK